MNLDADTIYTLAEPEDSELLRERMLDIESALAEAAEDDDGMDGF